MIHLFEWKEQSDWQAFPDTVERSLVSRSASQAVSSRSRSVTLNLPLPGEASPRSVPYNQCQHGTCTYFKYSYQEIEERLVRSVGQSKPPIHGWRALRTNPWLGLMTTSLVSGLAVVYALRSQLEITSKTAIADRLPEDSVALQTSSLPRQPKTIAGPEVISVSPQFSAATKPTTTTTLPLPQKNSTLKPSPGNPPRFQGFVFHPQSLPPLNRPKPMATHGEQLAP